MKAERGVGYLDRDRASTETDDEGGANVENSERTPLIKKNGKPLRTNSGPS